MTDPDLLPPSVDPNKKLIGIREVRALNDATARTISTVRDFEIVTDEPTGSNTAPTPLETVLSALVGCEGVIINRCAEALKFDYSGVAFACAGQVDARGSRGVAGVRGRCLIVNLPGSEKGVRESLTAVIDILPHAVEILSGSVGDHTSTPSA